MVREPQRLLPLQKTKLTGLSGTAADVVYTCNGSGHDSATPVRTKILQALLNGQHWNLYRQY